MKNLHHHSKKDFQVERIVLFSDAVFAIAITLLIIDIKVPVLTGNKATEVNFLNALELLAPKFLGFLSSFYIIGFYWSVHHRIFGFVINYNVKLIWLNLVFLFSIVLLPFSTAVYNEYSSSENIRLILPYTVYVFNICLTGFLNFLLWSYVGNSKNEVTENFPSGDFLKKAKLRSLLVPITFMLSLIIVFINPIIGRLFLCLTPFILGLVKNRTKRKIKINSN